MCDIPAVPDEAALPIVVALVILRPSDGRRLDKDVEITTETLAQFLPSDNDRDLVKDTFEQSGFEAGPVTGISFSITGDQQQFEKLFGLNVVMDNNGQWKVKNSDEKFVSEIPEGKVPEKIADKIEKIVFEQIIEMGPDDSNTLDF